jgi:cysteinyl-tRNA synthetase
MYGDFCNDLDTPRALIKLRALERDESYSPSEKAAIFESVDRLFGVDLLAIRPLRELSLHARELLQQRDSARRAKDFTSSDKIRDQLLQLGIEVRDTVNGQSWNWVSTQ